MRSLLFVPAHDARKCDKALVSGADALILDLEDAVPDAEKHRAREMCREFVTAHRERCRLFVRINALTSGFSLTDLEAVVKARPYGVMLPKCAGGQDVTTLAAQLAALEAREGIEPGAICILPIVTETAASMFGLGSYASGDSPRLCALFWGGEDLAADIGARANRDQAGRYTAPYQMARALTLLGATAAQVPAIDAVYTNFRDTDGLKAEAAEAVRDGFTAKVAIHPDQIDPIHEVFTPSEPEVAWARRVVETFDRSPAAGAVAIGGVMLDRPHYRSAQRLLARVPSQPL
ncbi:HpcH/HpaI aldolase/citrate lyase family protein [Azohydromonas australica]|uniref:HpcH/HpaI aldolase/citrate lyase family protein n=1 Tax=Azohydromonas australica TaxID=364039 RepID=UPI0003FC9FEF|nr:CoA ester lyase [Azohydromonas australica]